MNSIFNEKMLLACTAGGAYVKIRSKDFDSLFKYAQHFDEKQLDDLEKQNLSRKRWKQLYCVFSLVVYGMMLHAVPILKKQKGIYNSFGKQIGATTVFARIYGIYFVT